jgi:hypothetical protein
MANSALNKLKSRAKSKTLVGKQKNLDVNKNGKLDKEDFKILRGDKMAKGGLTQDQKEKLEYLKGQESSINEFIVLIFIVSTPLNSLCVIE